MIEELSLLYFIQQVVVQANQMQTLKANTQVYSVSLSMCSNLKDLLPQFAKSNYKVQEVESKFHNHQLFY